MSFMVAKMDLLNTLVAFPLENGAYKSKIIRAECIKTDRSFRKMCESNACGMYGKCHTCPPDAGDIDFLMGQIGTYEYALVYQTVTKIEDSFDFEGMIEAKKQGNRIAQDLRKYFKHLGIRKVLHLGAGGCGVCEVCAKQTNESCRFPELAMASLEAYGVDVSQLAKVSDMKYINGQNTVTYFGTVLFSLNGEEV